MTSLLIHKKPEVRFNHLFIVLDEIDIKAINQSNFINEITTCKTITTKANFLSYTGTYLFAHDNLLEFFQKSENFPKIGYSGIAFGTDRINGLISLKENLEPEYKVKIENRIKNIDDKLIPWFDELLIENSDFTKKALFEFWFMEYKEAYFNFKNLKIENNILSVENYQSQFINVKEEKAIKKFTGITMMLSRYEKDYLIKLFNTLSYKVENNNEYITPDNFRFKLKNREYEGQKSIKKIMFETSKGFDQEKSMDISNNISVSIKGKKGHFIFK